MDYYILDKTGKKPLRATEEQASEWFERIDDRRLERTIIPADQNPEGVEIEVSTVFLVIDHNFSGFGEPLLWETMIFGSAKYGSQCTGRYSTYDQAKIGHKKAVWEVRGARGALSA